MKRRARLSGERLILDYLGRLTEFGLYYLPKGSRVAFVGRTKAQIEREVGPAESADAERVRDVLAAMGDPEELVRAERTRIDAAWIKTTVTDKNLAQAAAAAINTPRKYRSITSRRKPATDIQALPRRTDAKSMSAPIGKMNDASDPFAAGNAESGGQAQPASGHQPPAPASQPSPGPAAAKDPGSSGRAPGARPGQSAGGRSAGMTGQALGAGRSGDGSGSRFPGTVGQVPGAADRAPGAADDAPGVVDQVLGPPSTTGPASTLGSPPAGGGTGATPGPGSARPSGAAATSVRSGRARVLVGSAARFTTDWMAPRLVQLSRTITALAREHVRETVAIVLIGLGGVIWPFPVWLVGALVALMSRLWGRLDKWVASAGPLVIVLLGAVVVAVIKGGSENAVVVYVDAVTADIGILLRIGCLLSAVFLAWRLQRGPRQTGKKLPPWERYRK